MKPNFLLFAVLALLLQVLMLPAAARSVTVTRTNYHGWAESLILSNGKIEAVVVPAVGRVMQLRLAGESDGPFWENRALDGQAPDAASKDWGNFGGDKAWPSPQADWPKVTDRSWPPPSAFDSLPVTAEIRGEVVELVSPVDRWYGIRTRRLVRLARNAPVMTIKTTFEKMTGAPVKAGVWVVSQLKHPVAVFAAVPGNSAYPAGYNQQSDTLPLGLKVEAGLLSLQRDPKNSTKVGNDAGTLLWIGEKELVRIDSPRVAKAEYPDQGSSAEIYTNPDPNAYVELELLGPLQVMKMGDKIERTSTYTLRRRSGTDALVEARRVLKR